MYVRQESVSINSKFLCYFLMGIISLEVSEEYYVVVLWDWETNDDDHFSKFFVNNVYS